jgi:hypothetical protein
VVKLAGWEGPGVLLNHAEDWSSELAKAAEMLLPGGTPPMLLNFGLGDLVPRGIFFVAG